MSISLSLLLNSGHGLVKMRVEILIWDCSIYLRRPLDKQFPLLSFLLPKELGKHIFYNQKELPRKYLGFSRRFIVNKFHIINRKSNLVWMKIFLRLQLGCGREGNFHHHTTKLRYSRYYFHHYTTKLGYSRYNIMLAHNNILDGLTADFSLRGVGRANFSVNLV